MRINRYHVLVALILLATLTILDGAIFAIGLSHSREARTVQALEVERQPAPDPTPTPGVVGPVVIDGCFVNVRGEWWPVTDAPVAAHPTVAAPGGPLRQLPDGRWAFNGGAGFTIDDLTPEEYYMLRPRSLCPDGWYSNPTSAGTLCPEAVEFMERYGAFRDDFEADYYRRHGR